MGKPRHLVAAAGAALGTGIAAGVVLALFSGGFFGIILPLLAGLLVGEAALRAGSQLSHLPFKVAAGLGALMGMLAGPLILGAPLPLALSPRAVVMGVLAAAAAVFRMTR